LDGPIAAVRDLDSRNGVFVNGLPCDDARLSGGDVIRCGEWIGIVEMGSHDGQGFGEIAPGWFGGSSLRAAVEAASRISNDLPVIVQGETGTGKEGMARALHGWSKRRGPFVAVNCAALPAELAEAELFGYRKGAFTGADTARPGLFRAADGGTIFLDEILDLPAPLQPKLLRVLEERRVRGLGETQEIPVDIRVLAATQEPLASAVKERRFRADLHARLDGLTVVLPPLRERKEDIVSLFQEFLRQHANGPTPKLEAKLIEALCLYDWPLNVRELLLLTRRLLGVHGREPTLKRSHLPERIIATRADVVEKQSSAEISQRPLRRRTDDDTEFEAFINALRANGGSVSRAAEAMGLSRARAYRLLAAHPDFSVDSVRLS
jgi:transcriptional regulator with PAS, ATPase and Fis domain